MGIASNGTLQWKFQRVANIATVIAGIVFICLLFCDNVTDLSSLQALLNQAWVKIFFIISLFILCLNSILAGWQIAADYAHKIHLPIALITGVVALISVVYFVYGATLLL